VPDGREEGTLIPATVATNQDNANVTAPDRASDRNGLLELVTVNLTARAALALDVAIGLTGDTRTDIINRALQVYAFLQQVAAHSRPIYVGETAGSKAERVTFF
jgi:hypothetical protein